MKEVNLKSVMGIFLLFPVLGLLFSILIYADYNSFKVINVNGFKNNNIIYDIDSIENNTNDKSISIKGWAVKKNKNLSTVKTYVSLRNVNTSQILQMNTVKEIRKDVTSKFNDSYNYDNCGFFAKFNKSSLKNKGQYEICILYLSDNSSDFVPTNKFIEINQ